jgi:3-phosphoshikimate 1-carboxyvinyltransferase
VIRGVGELRHKESDRVAGIAAGLTALGARVVVSGDDIEIAGGRALRGAAVATHEDHRLAMTFAVAGLIARDETLIRDPGSADVSYPGFFGELERMRA